MVDDLSKALGRDKGEWLKDIEHGDTYFKSFIFGIYRVKIVQEKGGGLKKDLTIK